MQTLENKVACVVPAKHSDLADELAAALDIYCGGATRFKAQGTYQGMDEDVIIVAAYCSDQQIMKAERIIMLTAYKLLVRGEHSVLAQHFDSTGVLWLQSDRHTILEALFNSPHADLYNEAVKYGTPSSFA